MKKMFYDRLAQAVFENEAVMQDFIRAYMDNTSYRNEDHACLRAKLLLGNAVEYRRTKTVKWKAGAITEEDIFACAKACNCTSDYLLGLSDRIN